MLWKPLHLCQCLEVRVLLAAAAAEVNAGAEQQEAAAVENLNR